MLNKSRPVLKAHQEVPRPPHEDGPRATQKRRPTARSAQQVTRLPPSRAGEHTDGRTRTVFQHCDATMCTSTHAGGEKKPPKVRARSGAVRPHEPTTPPPAALASRRSTQMPTAAQARGAVANPIRPKGQARREKKPETHKTRPSDKKRVGPAARSPPHGETDASESCSTSRGVATGSADPDDRTRR